MKTSTITKTLGALALLASSASMAASISVATSNAAPLVDDLFTMTVSGDLNNAFVATIEMSWAGGIVEYQSGVGVSPFTVYVKNDGAPGNNPTSFYIEIPAGSISGQADYAVLTFKALAAGAADFKFWDDGGTMSGWPDVNTFDPIVHDCSGPVGPQNQCYYFTDAVTVTGAAVPAPATVGLLATGLAGLVMRGVRRKRAVA